MIEVLFGQWLTKRPAPINRQNLTVNVGSVLSEEQGSIGNVLRRTLTLQGYLSDDGCLRCILDFSLLLRPEDGARCNAINPDLRCQFLGQAPRHHGKASLGNAVDTVIFKRSVPVNITDVDDIARKFLEAGSQCLT